jgi:hypothetical protein
MRTAKRSLAATEFAMALRSSAAKIAQLGRHHLAVRAKPGGSMKGDSPACPRAIQALISPPNTWAAGICRMIFAGSLLQARNAASGSTNVLREAGVTFLDSDRPLALVAAACRGRARLARASDGGHGSWRKTPMATPSDTGLARSSLRSRSPFDVLRSKRQFLHRARKLYCRGHVDHWFARR